MRRIEVPCPCPHESVRFQASRAVFSSLRTMSAAGSAFPPLHIVPHAPDAQHALVGFCVRRRCWETWRDRGWRGCFWQRTWCANGWRWRQNVRASRLETGGGSILFHCQTARDKQHAEQYESKKFSQGILFVS